MAQYLTRIRNFNRNIEDNLHDIRKPGYMQVKQSTEFVGTNKKVEVITEGRHLVE